MMPDGTELGEAKLRGVESSGMILAEDEVGIGADHAGHHGAPRRRSSPARRWPTHLPIADEVLELEITPNRPDAMASTASRASCTPSPARRWRRIPTAADAEPSGSDSAADHASVEIDPEICLRFTARVFEDVEVGPSPLWLKQRLMAAGQRPISNVVDITNYVMLATGQPLHAFDLDRVRGGRIVVRRARDGERMTTLDDVERTLHLRHGAGLRRRGPERDRRGHGRPDLRGLRTTTTRVLMEAATWVGPNIMRTSKALGLRSEASARFEKQLHPDQAIAAQRLAARLMVELCGARLVPGTLDVYPEPPRRRGLSAAPRAHGAAAGRADRPGGGGRILTGSGSSWCRTRAGRRAAVARQRRASARPT